LAKQDSQLSSEQSAALAQSYADQAMQHLHDAVRRGLTDVKQLKNLAALAPLRARPDFEELVATQSPTTLKDEP
jgi:hypothetical protein